MRYVLVTACVIIFGFVSASPLSAQIRINEFSSASSVDWIELYNDSDISVNIEGYILRDNTQSNKKELEGEVDAKGFVVIQWSSLNKDTDSILLINGDDEVDTVIYGTENVLAPSTEQSVGRLTDGDSEWVVFSSPTKGSSNNGSQVFQTPTPTPTVTPTATKMPTPTKTPKPTKKTDITNSPTSISFPTLQIKPTAEKENTTASETALLGTTDINESTVLHADSEDKEESEVAVMGASDRLYGGVAMIGGSILLFFSCGILLFKKYSNRIFE